MPHGTRPALIATVQELLACGVQKIAIVVPNLPSSRSTSDINIFKQWQYLSAFHHSTSSFRIDNSSVFCSVLDDDEGVKTWEPIISDYENLKQRTRFFFQQGCDKGENTGTGGDFTEVLQSALNMLKDDDGYMLAIRGECLPLRYLSSSTLQSSLPHSSASTSTSSSPSSSSLSSSTSSCVHSFLQQLSTDNPNAMDIKLSVCDSVGKIESEICSEDDYFSPSANMLQMSSSLSSVLSFDEKNGGNNVKFSGLAAFPTNLLAQTIDEMTVGVGECSIWGNLSNEYKMNDSDDGDHDRDDRGRKMLHPLDGLLRSLISYAPSSSFNSTSKISGVMFDGAYHHVCDEAGYRLVQEKIVLSKPFILDHIPINELEKAHSRRSRESLPSCTDEGTNDMSGTRDEKNGDGSVGVESMRK